jgi:2-methylcitrate dehydratase
MSATDANTADATLTELASFARSMTFGGIPADVVHEAKRRVIDTLGCAYGGYDSAPATIARQMVDDYRGSRGARILGVEQRTIPEQAAFANAIMIRALDFNDVNKGLRAGGHPSDVIPAILAVGDAFDLSGEETILGVTVAYQGYGSIPVHIKKRGWDQGILVAVGVAMGLGAMLRLNDLELQNAISLALTPNLPLAVTRRGDLSMWKNCASAAAGQTAMFGTFLAARGLTGPAKVFRGTHGLFEQATGEFELELDPAVHGFRVSQSDIKCYPSCGSTQAPLSALIEMAVDLRLEDIEAINVETHWDTWFETGREPEKWDPKSHETADHSLPYVMAVALRDGNVTPSSFTDEAIRDPDLRKIMQRIRITENPELTALRPAQTLSDIEIITRSGERQVARTGIPRGDHQNPLTDAELEKKFRGMAEPLSTPARCEGLLAELWSLERAARTAVVMDFWASTVQRAPAPV